MKNLELDNEGRPRANDDLKTLQQETQYAIFGQFFGLPACVVSGCEIRTQGGGQFDIAHGLVYIEGGIHRFNGVRATTLPMELYLDVAISSDPRPYFSGVSKDCMTERKVAARAVGGSGEVVLVAPEGILRFEKAREAVLRTNGELQWLTKLATADYDTDGRGKYGTNAHGWQLANGNRGAADLRGLFPVAFDSRVSEYAVGATGGAAAVTLAAAQVPQHTHVMGTAGDHSHGMGSAASDNNGTTGFGDTYAKSFGNSGGLDQNRRTQIGGNHSHTLHPSGGNATGSTDEHENRPPFFALGTREWIGLL